MQDDYINVMVILAGLIVFILVAAVIIKKLRTKTTPKKKQINILNVVPLGNKEKIALIEVKDTTILIGVTPHAINTLHVFSEELLPVDGERFTFSKHMAELVDK